MNNVILYALTVLIWGTTFFAIKLQAVHAPHEISILYRAALAALFLLVWCKMTNVSLRFKPIDHVFLCALGLSMFSLHYLFVFDATNYLVSGVIAVIFSSISFLNILNNFIFFKAKPSFNVSLGTLIGICGLCIFFWDEITESTLQNNTLKGVILAGTGTLIFSLGSSISRRNHTKGLDIVPSVTMGMVYGTGAMLLYTLLQSTPFVLPKSTQYWVSLLYLVIPGSIVAFLCYIKLIKNIGPELAGYTTILFPVIALVISASLEGYNWSIADFFGFLLIGFGNVLVLRKKSLRNLFISKSSPTPS